MPTYEYKCKDKDHRFSVSRAITADDDVTECPECGGPVLRVFTAPPISFNATGFGRSHA